MAEVERDEELVVQIMLKPNCGLENVRAALVVRRIAPLCDTLSFHPRTVKSDPSTISFLRDHGLFVRFRSPTPEKVLITIKSSLFVDRCAIIGDADAIPSFASASDDAAGASGPATPLRIDFANRSGVDGRYDELRELLARFEEVHRQLRTRIERTPRDRELNTIFFSHAQIVDGLRTTVARSRIEPFGRIAPSLHALVADYSERFGVQVKFDIADGHMALDQSVLASMEEIIKRVIRSCLRGSIGEPEGRKAAGKPPWATMHLTLESDGSEVICRIEHDGHLFDARYIGQLAEERGLLTRPIEEYTDEEIGSLLMMPGFASTRSGSFAGMSSQFAEIGSMLYNMGGRGKVRNTDHGTLEIVMNFPVPFTVMEAAIVRTGTERFALPAQQIVRFEEHRPERVVVGCDASETARYLDQDDAHVEMLNGPGASTPFAAEKPRIVAVLEAQGVRRALAVDEVHGYERISVCQLPALLNRRKARLAGCFGYAFLQDGTACAVVSVRRLLDSGLEEGAFHA